MDDRRQVRGPLLLFQAILPLLPKNGKFCFITSGAGTINKEQVPGQGAYGLSKAALNFLVSLGSRRRLPLEAYSTLTNDLSDAQITCRTSGSAYLCAQPRMGQDVRVQILLVH